MLFLCLLFEVVFILSTFILIYLGLMLFSLLIIKLNGFGINFLLLFEESIILSHFFLFELFLLSILVISSILLIGKVGLYFGIGRLLDSIYF